MSKLHTKQFPNESEAYRKTRNILLEEEMALRRHIEHVAEMRRSLPRGGLVKEDYEFASQKGNIHLSQLFTEGKNSLVIYSMMFDPQDDAPCPSCTSIVDGLNGESVHINQRVNFSVVGKAPIEKILHFAAKRGWDKIQFLSSYHNSYNQDYHAEEGGSQMPILNVFEKRGNDIYHFYATELLFAPADKGQDFRHVDSIWPIWNVFDLTPDGRGNDWNPQITYKK